MKKNIYIFLIIYIYIIKNEIIYLSLIDLALKLIKILNV